MAYVDLNPIRAGVTTRLDRSDHTSVRERIAELERAPELSRQELGAVCGLRSVPTLPLTRAEYIALVDWTGRQVRSDKKGFIPESEPPALTRLAIDATGWTLSVRGVGSRQVRIIGNVSALLERARAMQQRWLKGIGLARRLEGQSA